MKATGIVRRIDDLGRVVIPKEIRRTMRIREGDPLEIFTDNNGEVIFKKYSPIGEMGSSAAQLADAVYRQSKLPVVIFDRDHCIACAGISRREVLERRASQQCEEIMEARAHYSAAEGDRSIAPIEGVALKAMIIVSVIAAGDVVGAVAMLEGEKKAADSADEKLCSAAAAFLGMQMEE
ncbi:MAG: stage V sporulation T C-terminal domain-containing protein [Acutalibacteraceae bacterium]